MELNHNPKDVSTTDVSTTDVSTTDVSTTDVSTTDVKDEDVCAKNPGTRRAPGVPAKKTGKRLKRGAATQVMIYPRPATKAVIVEGSRRAKKSLSSFCITSALKETAALLGRSVGDLGISEQELRKYV